MDSANLLGDDRAEPDVEFHAHRSASADESSLTDDSAYASILMWGARSAFAEETQELAPERDMAASDLLAPELEVRADLAPATETRMAWGKFAWRFLVAWLALPLYVLRLLAREHRAVRIISDADTRATSAWHKCSVILLSGAYWVALLLLVCIAYATDASRTEAFFALILHTICCLTETAVRTVRVEAVPRRPLTERVVLGDARAPQRQDSEMTIGALLETRARSPSSLSSASSVHALRVAAVCAALLYGASASIARAVFALPAQGFALGVLGFACNALLGAVCLLVLVDSTAVLRERLDDAMWFRGLTSRAHRGPARVLSLSSMRNLTGWLALRAHLISRRGHGRVNTEIVLCAAFGLLVPLWLGVALEALLGGDQLSEYLAMAMSLCLLIGGFVLGTVWHAARTHRLYRDIDTLLLAKIETRAHFFDDAESAQLIAILDDIARLFQRAQEEGTLLRIFGLPVDEKAVGLVLGLLASSLSTAIGYLVSE